MTILSDKSVVTRKPHLCSGCHQRYPAKTPMRRQVNTYDGIAAFYTCMGCEAIIDECRDIDGIAWDGFALDYYAPEEPPYKPAAP